MKIKLLNALTYSLLGVSMLSVAYVAIPEFQGLFPQLDIVTATVTAIGTFLMSGGSILVRSFITRTKDTMNEQNSLMANKFLEITEEYNNMKGKVDNLESTNKELVKLLKIHLKTKLDNPLLTDKARELIEGALNEE
jgi:cell shape-determining protein MreC